MFKLIIAILSVFGVYLCSAMYWPSLSNKAFSLGEYPITGVELCSAGVVIVVFKFLGK